MAWGKKNTAEGSTEDDPTVITKGADISRFGIRVGLREDSG